MAKIEDGGPAFPNVDSDERVGVYVGDRGMTLRDFFAAHAISGCFSHSRDIGHFDAAMVAEEAYEIADAMLVERAKRPAESPGSESPGSTERP